MSRLAWVVVAATAASLAPRLGHAQAPSDVVPAPIVAAWVAPTRLVGFGGGFALGGERTSVDTSHPILQPANLEVRVPLSPRLELAAHVPLGNVYYGNVAEDGQRFAWFDVFAVYYPLRDAGGLFVAPGLGMIYGRTPTSSGVAVEVPVRLGWEFTRPSRGFATAISVRPWLDLVFPSGNVDQGSRRGVLVELTLIGYVTRR
ncbi:MAG: hypothetical protein NT062_26935 [Proteobacteria bacterium]|nr:hypothetical protein [Pseudomonadota bacterium]